MAAKVRISTGLQEIDGPQKSCKPLKVIFSDSFLQPAQVRQHYNYNDTAIRTYATVYHFLFIRVHSENYVCLHVVKSDALSYFGDVNV